MSVTQLNSLILDTDSWVLKLTLTLPKCIACLTFEGDGVGVCRKALVISLELIQLDYSTQTEILCLNYLT